MTDFPTAYITGMTRSLRSAVLATESPFSFVQQVQDTGGERWEFNIDVMVQGLGFEAFANAVINKRKLFHLSVPKAKRQINSPSLVLHLDAAKGAETIVVSGDWDSFSFKAGDMFSVLQAGIWRLHQVVADAPPNEFGGATVQIVPRLREALWAGHGITVTDPKITLRATSRAPATIGHVIHQFSIEAVEAL